VGRELSDAFDAAGGRALAMAILWQALRDLEAIIEGGDIDGEKMKSRERASMLDELRGWFFDTAPAQYSLEMVCAAIGYDADFMRGRIQQIFQRQLPVHLSRRRLLYEDVVEIRAKLKAGNSKASVAREYGLAAGYVSRLGNGKRRRAA